MRSDNHGFLSEEETRAYVEEAARRAAEPEQFVDGDLTGLSKRQQRKLRKRVSKELKRQLKESRGMARELEREQRQREGEQRRRAADVYRQISASSHRGKASQQAALARRDRAKSVLDAIGYELMYKNGLAEVERGLFSETIEFEDVTYQNAREEDQLSTLKVLFDLFNYFNEDTCVQFSVINTPVPRAEVAERRFYDPEAQTTPQGAADAREMNRILNEKLREGVSNITRRRLMTISTSAEDADEAWRTLSRINTDLAATFERLKSPWHVLDGSERLAVIAGVTRPGETLDFDYDRDLTVTSALTTKDFVAPRLLDFSPNGDDCWYRSGDACCQALVMKGLDSPLEDTVVAALANLALPLNVTWYVQPIGKSEALNFVRQRNTWLDSEIVQLQTKAVSQGYDYSLLPSETKLTKEETENLLEQLQGPQHLFEFAGIVWTWAPDFDRLSEQVVQIVNKARSNGVTLELLEMRQRQALNSVLPLGLNHVDVTRQLTTSETSIFVPFATVELDDENGNWYYQNKLSNNLVLGNRGRLSSPVGFVSGKTGSGKGFFVKNEIEGTMLSKPRDQVFIFDRAGEYLWLTEHWGGQCATFGVGKHAHLNPLGMMGLEGRSDETQVAFKADAIIAQAGASAEEAGMPLTDEERSIIQRCVERVFYEARRDGREPILEDLYRTLQRQPEPVAAQIALRYERYVKGATDFFNHASNVDFDARIVDLNLKEVPESMIVFALITLCESVRFQMYRNHERGIRTWLYIEEMESLFKYSTVLNYFARFSRECRKFGMYLTGITQSAESMMRNPEASTIVKQSDFVMLLRQSKEDRDYWTDALGLSSLQVGCIDDAAPRGNGLLIFGDSRIPIKGDFPKDSYLYDLYSTDPNEAEHRREVRAGRAGGE